MRRFCNLGLNTLEKTLDVYRAHRTNDLVSVLKQCGFEIVYIPGNCTSELQPLDLSVNSCLKAELKQRYTMWYADKVCLAIRTHDTKAAVASVSPDLRLSTLQPLHAQWLMQSFEVLLSNQIELVQRGWRQSGILVANQQPANISIPTDGEPQQHDTSTALDTRTVSLVTTTSTEKPLLKK